MRKLKLQVQISVDGFVADSDGKEDWKAKGDLPLFQLINELLDTSDTILLGRKFAEVALPHFEAVDSVAPKSAFSLKIVNTQKVIFSKTLDAGFGKNTSLATGKLADEIAKLKNQAGKDILVYGGAEFVSSLIAGGHIDEFYFFVNPVLINKGMRIFDLLGHRQNLDLISAASYENGVAVLHYKLNKE